MRRLGVVVVCSITAALALAAAAPARVIDAGSVLPPGESGLVLAGGPSSHATDQVGLFTSVTYKPALLGGGGEESTPRPGVRVVRDAYGVPAVYGDTEADAWWGVGYVTAQDRLAQIELFRRAAAGRLAEVLGPDSLGDDLASRRDYYTDHELRVQLKRLPSAMRARFPAFADGVNAWLDHLRATPADVPVEFSSLNIALPTWTAVDSLRIGDFLLRTVPSDDGNELANLAALRALGPKRFQKVLPLRVPGQVTTIPAADGRFPSQPGRTRKQERAAWRRSRRWAKTLPLPSTARAAEVPTGMEQEGRTILGGHGSFMWAIKRPGGGAFLYSGPQLGYNAPQRLYEIEVHSPVDAVRGVVPPGVPAVAIGHNEHVAWGFTSALSDDDDLFAERLKRPGSRQYRFKGRWRTMKCREEVFGYRTGATTRKQRETVCRTVHGPVQARVGRTAYARRYGAWQHEGDSLVGISELTRARSVAEVDRAMRAMTWTENVLAADDAGHIGFWHPGNYPLRSLRYDERLPFPGTGQAEWRGLLSRKAMPRVIDPQGRSWLVNWNNPPSADFTSGDGPAREQLNGPYHRVAMLQALVRGAAGGTPDLDAASAGIVRRSSVLATQRPTAGPALQRALDGATGPAAAVLSTLVAWDGDYDRTAADGTVDPGVATWRAFKAAAQVEALGRPNAAERGLVGRPGEKNFVEASLGETYALRTLHAAGYRRAAAAAAAALTKQFGSATPAAWREPRTTLEAEPLGLVSAPVIPLINRGSWEQRVELGP